MNICFISPYSPRTVNGIGTFILSLAKYLRKNDHKPFLFTNYENPEIDIEDVFDSNNILEIKHTARKNLANIHFTLLTLVDIYKSRHDVDILHLQQTYMLSAFSAIFGKLLGIPVVTTAHLKVIESRNPLKKLINSIFIYLTLKYSGEVVYVSGKTQNSFGTSKGVVIRNGIDTDIFTKNYEKRAEMREQLHLNDQFIILFASRWTENKGIYDLLNAFAIIRERIDMELKLILIGSGENNIVISTIESLNLSEDVLPIGRVQSVHEYYCMADLFILPSQFEGLPMALLEAMSSGLPSIASKVGGNPELISSGINGLLIEPSNLDELVETIMWCISNRNDLDTIGINAAKTVNERFSMGRVTDEYMDVYKKLITG